MALTDGLVAYYKLNEASGNRASEVGSGLTLTDVNTVGSGTGKVSDGASFVRANSEELTSTSTVFHNNFYDPFSFCGWFKLNNTTDDCAILSVWGSETSEREYRLYFRASDDKLVWEVQDDAVITYWSVASSETLSSGTWYFFYCYYNGSDTIGLTVDNGSLVSNKYDMGINVGSYKFSVGWADSTGYLWGMVDELGRWNRLLGGTEVSDLYASGAGLTYPFTGSTDANINQGRGSLLLRARSASLVVSTSATISASRACLLLRARAAKVVVNASPAQGRASVLLRARSASITTSAIITGSRGSILLRGRSATPVSGSVVDATILQGRGGIRLSARRAVLSSSSNVTTSRGGMALRARSAKLVVGIGGSRASIRLQARSATVEAHQATQGSRGSILLRARSSVTRFVHRGGILLRARGARMATGMSVASGRGGIVLRARAATIVTTSNATTKGSRAGIVVRAKSAQQVAGVTVSVPGGRSGIRLGARSARLTSGATVATRPGKIILRARSAQPSASAMVKGSRAGIRLGGPGGHPSSEAKPTASRGGMVLRARSATVRTGATVRGSRATLLLRARSASVTTTRNVQIPGSRGSIVLRSRTLSLVGPFRGIIGDTHQPGGLRTVHQAGMVAGDYG
jgi:hypothetical protein